MTRWIAVAGIVLGSVVFVALAYWQLCPVRPIEIERAEPEAPLAIEEPAAVEPVLPPVEAPDVAETAPEPRAIRERIELPPLADSDAFVREQAGEDLARLLPIWLAEKDLVRGAVALLDHGRSGAVPEPLIAFIGMPGRFAVRRVGERIVMDSRPTLATTTGSKQRRACRQHEWRH